MARFPTTEAEIVVLAQAIIAGLTAHTALYPTPPVSPKDLQTKLEGALCRICSLPTSGASVGAARPCQPASRLPQGLARRHRSYKLQILRNAPKLDEFLAKQSNTITKRAEAEQAGAEEDEALEELTDAMRNDLRYAENTVRFDDNQLKLVGWGGRAAPTPLRPPGQPRALEAPRQGEDWVFLDWKEPAEGGRVTAYKVQRREMPSGAWQDVAMAMESEAMLVNQERGK